MLPQHVTNLIQDSQVGQECQRRAATRVGCAASLQALGLASEGGETAITTHLAGMHMQLLKAYDPK